MKKGESLAATNQLIRFIRGDVEYEEFYSQPSEKICTTKSAIFICGFSSIIGLLLILAGYWFLSWQVKTYKSQLAIIERNLEMARLQSVSPEELEAKEILGRQQKRLYEDVLAEKLSLSCIFKELTHLISTDTFFRRVLLKNVTPQAAQEKEGKRISKKLILEGSVIKKDVYGGNDFPKFLDQLKQSSFFQKVLITYQNELDTGFGRSLDFILTCDLR